MPTETLLTVQVVTSTFHGGGIAEWNVDDFLAAVMNGQTYQAALTITEHPFALGGAMVAGRPLELDEVALDHVLGHCSRVGDGIRTRYEWFETESTFRKWATDRLRSHYWDEVRAPVLRKISERVTGAMLAYAPGQPELNAWLFDHQGWGNGSRVSCVNPETGCLLFMGDGSGGEASFEEMTELMSEAEGAEVLSNRDIEQAVRVLYLMKPLWSDDPAAADDDY